MNYKQEILLELPWPLCYINKSLNIFKLSLSLLILDMMNSLTRT